MTPRTLVFGPAYLDRVVRVDRPLIDPTIGPPLDLSVDGRWRFGDGLTLVDPTGSTITIALPDEWPGPRGEVKLSRSLSTRSTPWQRAVQALSWHDDLGGMGAGFAAAFGGELISALGPENDSMSQAITALLERAGVKHHAIRVPDQPADWTLLITSAEFGDKLPIGFRGCHAALSSLSPWADEQPCALRVVAALPNSLAAQVLRAPGAAVRFFAPALRNMTDRDCPISGFAESIDVLSCNRREWESLADREEVAWRVSILAITDGPNGSLVRFTTPTGEPGRMTIPAFPRSHPPRDTNRAGEAYAAALVTGLLEGGWDARSGVVAAALMRSAAERASAAAALVLGRPDFGFPSPTQISEAIRAGRVESELATEDTESTERRREQKAESREQRAN
jgi:ribokinase